MTGRPASRKRLMTEHAYRPDDAECCTWKDAGGRICGLPENNRHHITNTIPPPMPDRQKRLDIDG